MNSNKIITREEIEAYFYCSLGYRYQYNLDIPYREQDKNKLFVQGAKYAVSSWFDSIAKGRSRKKARNRMGLRLDLIWRNLRFNPEDYPMAHAMIMQILLELESNFRESRDLIIGGGLTATMPLAGWGITDTIDGVFIQNGNKAHLPRSKRPIVGVQVASDFPPDRNPNILRLRHAIAKYSLNVGSGDVFGKGHPPKLLVLYVPSMRARTYELEHEEYKEVIWLARSALRALDANVYAQSTSVNRCKSCWYQHECSNYFTVPEPSVPKLGKLRRSVQDRLDA